MRLLLAGQATSELGSQVGSIALPLVAVVALVVGAARVLFDVAYPSYLPALVGRDDLVRADAYLESSRSATQLAGPGLGGWLSSWPERPASGPRPAASWPSGPPSPARPGPVGGTCAGSWPRGSGSCSPSPPCGPSPPARP